jgi:hypoxanthine-DNA glycosylase
VLVLGSLPGEASLAAGRYYAHPLNQFWRLIGGAIGQDIAALDYDARLAALLAAGVGLWDTIGSARRSGSLDGAIRDAEANPLAALVAGLPNLRCVAFNGATSARIGGARWRNLTAWRSFSFRPAVRPIAVSPSRRSRPNG